MNTAIGAIAPYRLGLTATPERADGQDALLPELVGPIVYRREIKELAGGEFLAPYRVEKRFVDLSAEETERYQAARQKYREFVSARGISMSGPNGWGRPFRKPAAVPRAAPPSAPTSNRNASPRRRRPRSNCSKNSSTNTTTTAS
jgi:superfamily II DNA or RNA helicase